MSREQRLTAEDGRVLLKSMTLPQLTDWLTEELGVQAFRAKQIWHWLYVALATDFDEMTNLSKDLRATLKERARINAIELHDERIAQDGTTKLLWKLDTGAIVETVMIPAGKRNTLCVSSQVGCAMNCQFCYTARMGFQSNLSTAEIVDQVVQSRKHFDKKDLRLTNIVFMGMGEPLHNPNNVIPATNVLCDQTGLAFGTRKVTVSTSGLVPEIVRFGKESGARLAVSLNATTDEVRDWIMPINRRYPLAVLLDTLRDYPYREYERVTFEYVMLNDVNDSMEDAARIVTLTEGIPCMINLIPFNPHEGTEFTSSPDERIREFREHLVSKGMSVTVRETRGDDGMAACGQLGKLGDRSPKRMQAPERFEAILNLDPQTTGSHIG